MGNSNLPPIDLFNDLDPLLPPTQETQEFNSVVAIPECVPVCSTDNISYIFSVSLKFAAQVQNKEMLLRIFT